MGGYGSVCVPLLCCWHGAVMSGGGLFLSFVLSSVLLYIKVCVVGR